MHLPFEGMKTVSANEEGCFSMSLLLVYNKKYSVKSSDDADLKSLSRD